MDIEKIGILHPAIPQTASISEAIIETTKSIFGSRAFINTFTYAFGGVILINIIASLIRFSNVYRTRQEIQR